jgi:hypothetical protein
MGSIKQPSEVRAKTSDGPEGCHRARCLAVDEPKIIQHANYCVLDFFGEHSDAMKVETTLVSNEMGEGLPEYDETRLHRFPIRPDQFTVRTDAGPLACLSRPAHLGNSLRPFPLCQSGPLPSLSHLA